MLLCAGTAVKMPCYGISIAEAVARKQAIKWYTGLLMKPYLPWSFDQKPTLPNGLAAPGEGPASLSISFIYSHRLIQMCISICLLGCAHLTCHKWCFPFMGHKILGDSAYVHRLECMQLHRPGRELTEESAMLRRHSSRQPCAHAAAPAHAAGQARLGPLITQQPSTPDTSCVRRPCCSSQPTSEDSAVKPCIVTPAIPTTTCQHGLQPATAHPAVHPHTLSPAMHATSCQPAVWPATEPPAVSFLVHASADSFARRPGQLVSAAVTDWGPGAQPGHTCSFRSTSSCGRCTQP